MMKKGFTLIELLVVVLIVGILAAIAVPQYQKAVEKARAMQSLSLMKTMSQAMEEYFMIEGNVPSSFDEFSFSLPQDWTGNQDFYQMGFISDSRSNGEWGASIEKGNSGVNAVHIGRLTGPYRGSGFSYYVTTHMAIPAHQVLCTEVISTFSKPSGDFCVKFFKGKQVHKSGVRLYTLP